MRLILMYAIVSSFLGIGQAQSVTSSGLRPSALEAFATNAGVKVSWTHEVSRIASTEAQAVISAVVLENSSSPVTQLRGVRIDLSDGSARDTVYIEENKALDERRQR